MNSKTGKHASKTREVSDDSSKTVQESGKIGEGEVEKEGRVENRKHSIGNEKQPNLASKTDSLAGQDEAHDWKPGELLWARVGRYPLWPCVLMIDPASGQYTKTRDTGRGSGSGIEMVHVQFFGDKGSHSWVSKTWVMKFEGKEHFDKLAQEMKNNKKYSPAFAVRKSSKQKWELAVEEAENSLTQPRQDRVYFFEDCYPIKQKKGDKSNIDKKKEMEVETKPSSSLVRKRKQTTKETEDNKGKETESSNSKSSKETEKEKDLEEAKPKKKVKKIVRKRIKKRPGVFDVFVKRTSEHFMERNPKLRESEETLLCYLSKMWSTMDEEERSKYPLPVGSEDLE